jgi:hypothetical protein
MVGNVLGDLLEVIERGKDLRTTREAVLDGGMIIEVLLTCATGRYQSLLSS